MGLFFFFMIRLGSWVTGRKTTGVKWQFHLLLARVHITDMTHACRCWPWSLDWSGTCQFFHCKIILFPTSLTCICLRAGCPGPSLLWAGPARASHCSRSSCYGHGLWGVQAQEWQHTGWAALRRVDLPGPGPKPVSPALAGQFLTSDHWGSLPLSILHSLEELVIYSPHLQNGEVYSPSLRAEYLHKFFGILHKGFVSSPPCITLFNHLSIFV